jgi:hypothetical protein
LGILQAVTLYFSPFFAGEKWRDLWLAILAGSGEKNKKAGRGQCDSPDIGESPLICRFGGERLPPKTARNGDSLSQYLPYLVMTSTNDHYPRHVEHDNSCMYG